MPANFNFFPVWQGVKECRYAVQLFIALQVQYAEVCRDLNTALLLLSYSLNLNTELHVLIQFWCVYMIPLHLSSGVSDSLRIRSHSLLNFSRQALLITRHVAALAI